MNKMYEYNKLLESDVLYLDKDLVEQIQEKKRLIYFYEILKKVDFWDDINDMAYYEFRQDSIENNWITINKMADKFRVFDKKYPNPTLEEYKKRIKNEDE